ncbi:hypothetical protein [Chitinophaga sp. Cy-1792]|nr:hypothetical protein [Chitinophaga sp. Cy-1792]
MDKVHPETGREIPALSNAEREKIISVWKELLTETTQQLPKS